MKIRRRGNRLIKTIDDIKLSYHCHDGRWRLYEGKTKTRLDRFTPDASEQYVLWRSVDSTEDPPEFDSVNAVQGHGLGPDLAYRIGGAKYAWLFLDPNGGDAEFISTSQCCISNVALIASFTAARTIDPDLARFLDVAELLVPFDEVLAVHKDPRFAALKDFEFEITPPTQMPAGHRAASILRHRHSNWDEMLRIGGADVGGLLYPEQYDQVRRGVDRLIASTQKGELL